MALQVEKGGEDAYFVSTTGGGVIGVADGVSGVAEDGIDPALYSKELMKLAQEAADGLPTASVTEDPRSVLEAAHKGVQAQGACTAVVAALDSGSGKLRVANLGDSGLRVLRRGRICFATPALQVSR
jgi:protein phosphatase PTC7